ncbi:MAG: TetR/AcrR family transcriptional regulator [Anaerolineaceae bacterium]
MNPKTYTKRKYDSSRRKLMALETRKQISESARGLFFERGYVGTTIESIAQASGVSTETVYAIFQNKRNILSHILDIAVGGDELPIKLVDRPGPQAVFHETDPAQQIKMFSRDISKILVRAAPVFEILRSTAKSDDEIAGLLKNRLKGRMENMKVFVQHIDKNHGLREGLSVQSAAELVWTITSPDVFLLLTRDQDYSLEKYENWLELTLGRLLLN